MENEIKPVKCGCGGEAQYEAYENYNFGSYIAHIMICDKCGMRTAEWPSEAEAIEAWNRAMGIADKSSTVERTAKVVHKQQTHIVPPKSTTVAYETETNLWDECGNCGAMGMYHGWKYCPSCGARLEWE